MSQLQKGTRVLLSKLGHRGFYYPGEKEYSLLYDVVAKERAWVGGGNTRTAGIIPENALFVSGSPDKEITVWFNKADASRLV
jgi:hypothetical protein